MSSPGARILELFSIRYPIIQGGMVWVSGANLAAAVSEAGGLGLIGAGSMKPDLLRLHIEKARTLTKNVFGVNIPLLRRDAEELIHVAIDEHVPIVFTSAGHPGRFITPLLAANCTVVHVAANAKQAKKAEEVGCRAVVAEGFEAGGHNGPDELTTLTLVPQVVDAVKIPVIAAGGIADGRHMAAAFALGADGVQIGTRFAATTESSAHDAYKKAIVDSSDTGTVLTFRRIGPVRMLKNAFAREALDAEARGATREEILLLLGTKREQAGIFDGDILQGELEAGQSAGGIHDIPTAREVIRRLVAEWELTRSRLK